MKTHRRTATQDTVIQLAIESLTPSQWNDKPAIRQALNDIADSLEKDGELSCARSNRWSQDKMVKAVSSALRAYRSMRVI